MAAAKKSAAKSAAKKTAEAPAGERTATIEVEGEVVDAGAADTRVTDPSELPVSEGADAGTPEDREAAKASRIDPGARFEDIERDRPGPGEIGYTSDRPPGAVRGRREPVLPSGPVAPKPPTPESEAKFETHLFVATELGFDGLKRRKVGDVFKMRIEKGVPLPSWVALAGNDAKTLAAVGREASQYENDPVHDENVEIADPSKASKPAARKRSVL